MPRLVDHTERRRMITDAVRRVIARSGLEAATFHAVAAEAGISVRLVQYYFGNKDELLRATHRSVIEDSAQRFGGASPDAGSAASASPRDLLRTILEALLPLDAERRQDAAVLAAFHAAALSGHGAGSEFLLGAPRALVDVVAAQLAHARAPRPGAGRELELDAELVVAAVTGLAQGMLPGFYSDVEARALVEHLLDRLMGPDVERRPYGS